MNKNLIILNLIIYLFSTVNAINETNTTTGSDELSERTVKSVTIQHSPDKDVSNVHNHDFVTTSKLIGKKNPTKTFFVKIRRLKDPEKENDKALTTQKTYNTTTEESKQAITQPPEEDNGKKLSSKTNTIDEEANDSIEKKYISKIDTTTENLHTKENGKETLQKPLEDDIELELVTKKSVIDEKSDVEIPNEELPYDKEDYDDIEFTRRMMTDRHREKANIQDWEYNKNKLIMDTDQSSLLDIKARSEIDFVKQPGISESNIKPKLMVKAQFSPATVSKYGYNINNPANIYHQPDVIQRQYLQNPALFNIHPAESVDLHDMSSFERSNLGNTYVMPTTRSNYFHRQLPLEEIEEPMELMQHPNDNHNSDLFSNAYPFTPILSKTALKEPTATSGSNLLSKLIDASQHSIIGDNLYKTNTNRYNRMYFNNYKPKFPLRPNFNNNMYKYEYVG